MSGMPEKRDQNLARKILSAAAVILFIVFPLWLGLETRQGPSGEGTAEHAGEAEELDGGLHISEGPRIRRQAEKFFIEWTTSRPADSLVRFGKGRSFGQVLSKDEAFVKRHRVELPSLPYVWLYHFWIVSQDRERHEVSTTYGPDRWSTGAAFADVSDDYPLLSRTASGAFWADFDGDLDPDVLLTSAESERRQARLLCRENAAYRDCTERLRVSSGSGPVTKADWADYNGDGYSDLLLCCQGLVVCQNYGPPAYRLGRTTALIEIGRESPVVCGFFAHADSDELLDVVALQADRKLTVYRNSGGSLGRFERARQLEPETLAVSTSENTARKMARADFSGDGRDDLLLLPEGTILEATGQGYEISGQAVETPADQTLMAAACSDFDSDGDADVFAVLSPEEDRFGACRLFRNTDEGFVDITDDVDDLAEMECKVSCATWIDVTGEGNADLLLGTEGGEVRVLLSDGKGNFTDATEALGVDLERDELVQQISGSDITGNDDADLFIAFSEGRSAILRNDFSEWAPQRFVGEGSPSPIN